MNKRLRKKLHRGEFQEFGFAITWHFTRPLDTPDLDLFFDALVETASESGLTFGGGGSSEHGSGFLCRKGRGSITEEHRSQVAAWFQEWGPALSATVGPPEDAWQSQSPQVTIIKDWIGRGGDVVIMPPARQ